MEKDHEGWGRPPYLGHIQSRVFGLVPRYGRRITYRRRISHELGYDLVYLFPSISSDAEEGALIRGKALMTAAEMTHALKSHARGVACEKADFLMHYFRSGGGGVGGAITRALAGEYLSRLSGRGPVRHGGT